MSCRWEAGRWSVDPFGGEERDGIIYGRGAVDMKQMVALQLTLMLHFARQARATGQPLARDLILLAVADEECGGELGMKWIVENRPEWIDAEYALNEGGGFAVELGGTRIYLCEMAQKGSMRVTLQAEGTPGHASVPHNDNALVRLARAISAVGAAPLPLTVIPTTRRFIQTLAKTQSPARGAIFRQVLSPRFSERVLARLDPDTANALRAMLHTTLSVTMAQAGTALNVIPGQATAQIDCRCIPGQTAEWIHEQIRQRINDPRVAITIEQTSPGYEMQPTPLFDAIRAAVATHDSGAIVAPYLFPAVSDSRYLAPRGVAAYGFIPHKPETGMPQVQSLAHGHDERISRANVAFGLAVLHDTIRAISTR